MFRNSTLLRQGRVVSFILALILLAALQAFADPLPKTLKVLTDADDGHVIMFTNCRYDAGKGQTGVVASGKGDLVFKIAGKVLPKIPGVPIKAIIADKDGFVSGGGADLPVEISTPALFGGLSLVIAKGSSLLFDYNGGAPHAAISGPITLKLPYRNEKGEQEILNLPKTTIDLRAAGNLSFSTKGATLTGPATKGGIQIACFKVTAKNVDVSVERHPKETKPLQMDIAFNDVKISTTIPALLTQDPAPLTLTAKNVTVDETGAVTFNNAGLATTGQVIHLTQPLDFVLTVKSASVSVEKGSFKNFEADADLTLPPQFKDAKGDRFVIPLIGLNFSDGSIIPITQPIALKWNNFGLKTSGVIIDISSKARHDDEPAELKEEWQGVFFQTAQIDLPESFKDGDKPFSIKGTKFRIDKYGLTGKAELQPGDPFKADLQGFAVEFSKAKLDFSGSELMDSEIEAKMDIPALGVKAGLNVGVTSAGLVSASIKMGEPFKVDKCGGLIFSLSGASFQQTTQGKPKIALDGQFSFDKDKIGQFEDLKQIKDIANSVFDFKGLGVMADGNFDIPENMLLTLPHPANLDLEVFSVNVTQVGFVKRESDKKLGVKFVGGVKLADDLPVSAEVDFDGITVFEDAKVDWGKGLFVRASIAEVGSFSGHVGREALGADYPNEYCVRGSVEFAVQIAETSAPLGGGFEFVACKRGWYVFGNAMLPAGIPIADTGLAFYAFKGGVGHNVKFRPGDLVPGDKGFKVDLDPSLGNWLFSAGVRIGTLDPISFWGDGTLTIVNHPFALDITARCAMLTPQKPYPVDWDSMDRTGYANISWDWSTKAFRAAVVANAYMPTKKVPLVFAGGSFEFVASPNDQHLFIGWPMDDQHPFKVDVFGLRQISGGVGVSLKPERYVKAGIKYRETYGLGIAGFDVAKVEFTLWGGMQLVYDGPPNYDFKYAEGMVGASGQASLMGCSGYVEGTLNARYQAATNLTVYWSPVPIAVPDCLVLTGAVKGCAHTWLGDVCKTGTVSWVVN